MRKVDNLDEVSLAKYAGSAMGGASVGQQQVFGGMNVTGVDDEGRGGRKIPVEIRSMFSQFRSWAEFVNDAQLLVKRSRQIIK